MELVTIYVDVRISKAKRAHVAVNEAGSLHRWHTSLGQALAQLHDDGHETCVLSDDQGTFEISFRPVDPPDN